MKKNPIFFRKNYKFLDSIKLNQEELEHLRTIRLDREDKYVEFRDGNGNSYLYFISSKKDAGELVESSENVIRDLGITLACALPKSQKLDLILQKGTELGVSNFHLITFLQSDRKEINEERAQKIILSAVSQSRRHSIPSLNIHNSLKSYLDTQPNSFYLHPYSHPRITSLSNFSLNPVIGPEGGFREEEINLFTEYNCSGYNLGENILRIETAAIYITSLIQYEKLRTQND
jgi:16S rRNA (uracil1498-N3)-methyltransferase